MKRGVLRGLRSAGAFSRAANSSWRQERLLILCYHGVSISDEHEWNDSLYITPRRFEQRMEILKKGGYSVLPLGEAIERIRTRSLPARSVALTFDDGTSDFYLEAYPILKSYGFPATVYLTTYYCNYNKPVFTVFCSYLLWKGRHKILDRGEFTGLEQPIDLATPQNRNDAFQAILNYAYRRHLSGEAENSLMQDLAHHLGLSYEDLVRERILHIMRPEDISELISAGIDIQLHTHRHRVPRQQDLFAREIEENRAWILKLGGKPAVHFCYPSGEYHDEFLPWLRQLGVVSATTCVPGLATRRCDPLLLPRLVDVSALCDLEFEGWLSGVASFIPSRRETGRFKGLGRHGRKMAFDK